MNNKDTMNEKDKLNEAALENTQAGSALLFTTKKGGVVSILDVVLKGADKKYREKLESRLKNMVTDTVEPQRLAQEVAIIADRCAIDEELSRLDSHIRQMRKYLESSGEIGKKMDFLIQEMNREANTIGSKASDAAIAQHVVDLKSEIEKLREQIQNVE